MESEALMLEAEDLVYTDYMARQAAIEQQIEAIDNERRIEEARWRLGGE